jgi:hypothetical protein
LKTFLLAKVTSGGGAIWIGDLWHSRRAGAEQGVERRLDWLRAFEELGCIRTRPMVEPGTPVEFLASRLLKKSVAWDLAD